MLGDANSAGCLIFSLVSARDDLLAKMWFERLASAVRISRCNPDVTGAKVRDRGPSVYGLPQSEVCRVDAGFISTSTPTRGLRQPRSAYRDVVSKVSGHTQANGPAVYVKDALPTEFVEHLSAFLGAREKAQGKCGRPAVTAYVSQHQLRHVSYSLVIPTYPRNEYTGEKAAIWTIWVSRSYSSSMTKPGDDDPTCPYRQGTLSLGDRAACAGQGTH